MNLKNKVVSILRKIHKTINEEAGQKASSGQEEKVETAKKEQKVEQVSDTMDQGEVKIADDVLLITAAQAAMEIDGVVGMSGGLSDDVAKLMGKEKAAKGVRITSEGRKLAITVYLEIEYGVNIPELALNVQASVKRNIQDLTGYDVEYVDVHIENVAQVKKGQAVVTEVEK